jgi:hypothetical protein
VSGPAIPGPAIRLYIGGSACTIGGERVELGGYRCVTAAHSPRKIGKTRLDLHQIVALLDSGAFTDPPERRLQPETALVRQLEWEAEFSELHGAIWQAELIVSYDRLIDEVWLDGQRHKRRWSVGDAVGAVSDTIEAARYLASRRRDLWPRGLVLACQGVDADQYEECVDEILRVAAPNDTIGFGGWCILGRFRSWLPVFWETCWRTFPKIASAGLSRVHIFGVLFEPALAPALWLADKFGLRLSVDSAAPMMACTRSNAKKAGIRVEGDYRANVRWWQAHLANLRQSQRYRAPMRLARQAYLFPE